MRGATDDNDREREAGPEGPADDREDEKRRQYQEQIEKGVSEENAAEVAADEPEPPKSD